MQRVQADLIAQQPVPISTPAVFPPRRKTVVSASVVIPPPARARKPATNWFGLVTRTLVGVGVAAAMLLLVVRMVQLRSTTNLLTTQLASTQQQLTKLQAQNSQLHTINQTLEQKLQDQTTQMVALRNDFNMLAQADRMISLKGTPKSPNANGAFYIGNDATGNNDGVLVVSNLQPLAPNQTYQFWLLPADGPPVSAGLIPVLDVTTGTLTVKIPAQNSNFANVGLSIEPSGGSPAPTGDIVLLSQTA
jgi:anti-sigma-K factor RskA